jgi:hypothetical protein
VSWRQAIIPVRDLRKEKLMPPIDEALRQVQEAAGLPALLAAAARAFEVMLAEIQAWQDPDSALFTVYVMAAGYAADGRDAVLSAPSMPRQPRRPGPDPSQAAPSSPTAASATGDLARLCQALAGRLGPAAAPGSGDHEACAEAARSARVVAGLLGGAGQ